ncbi:MAG: DUF3520 domain-containing protein [Aquincola sp.]|nr:DUF3520 domain-containing protein [Aquincola sp.]
MQHNEERMIGAEFDWRRLRHRHRRHCHLDTGDGRGLRALFINRQERLVDHATDRQRSLFGNAGEIGAGHTVTALYEVIPAGLNIPGVDAALDKATATRSSPWSPRSPSSPRARRIMAAGAFINAAFAIPGSLSTFAITSGGADPSFVFPAIAAAISPNSVAGEPIVAGHRRALGGAAPPAASSRPHRP